MVYQAVVVASDALDSDLEKFTLTMLMEPDSNLVIGPEFTKVTERRSWQLISTQPKVSTNISGLTQATELRIETGEARPISISSRPVPEAWEDKVDVEVQVMLGTGVIEKCYSPWTSPIVPVTKKDGSVRVCIDFKKVNNVTRPDHYLIPCIEDFLETLGTANFISTLDLSKGYYWVPVVKRDQDKTVFGKQI